MMGSTNLSDCAFFFCRDISDTLLSSTVTATHAKLFLILCQNFLVTSVLVSLASPGVVYFHEAQLPIIRRSSIHWKKVSPISAYNHHFADLSSASRWIIRIVTMSMHISWWVIIFPSWAMILRKKAEVWNNVLYSTEWRPWVHRKTRSRTCRTLFSAEERTFRRSKRLSRRPASWNGWLHHSM